MTTLDLDLCFVNLDNDLKRLLDQRRNMEKTITRLNELLEQIEGLFLAVHPGVPAFIELNESYELGFGKHNDRWGFLVKHKSTKQIKMLSHASMLMRFEALSKFSELARQLVIVSAQQVFEINAAITKFHQVLQIEPPHNPSPVEDSDPPAENAARSSSDPNP